MLSLGVVLGACTGAPVVPGATGGGTGGGGGTAGGAGTHEPCCVSNPDGGRIGTISTCYCPPVTACNYGLFERCAGDTCVDRIGPPPDGGYCAP